MKWSVFYIVSLALLSAGVCTRAQELHVGDQMPDYVFKLLNQGKDATVSTSSYSGKLLIIDCWNIYCGPCIKAMPELSAIQSRFRNKLNILTVEGSTSKELVMKFLEQKAKKKEGITLPVAYLGSPKISDFHKLFPVLHYGFPVEIWINETGKIIGITNSSFVNDETIQEVLAGNYSILAEKHYQAGFDPNLPLLTGGNGGPDIAFTFRSMITRFIDSIPNSKSISIRTDSLKTRLFFANRSIADLFKTALWKNPGFDNYDKQLQVVSRDSTKIKAPSKGMARIIGLKKNGYCYELILPAGKNLAQAYQFMQTDLERFFGFKARIDTLPLRCLVLEASKAGVARSANDKAKSEVKENDDFIELTLLNSYINLFAGHLNKRSYPIIIDRTNISYPVDIHIKIPIVYDFKVVQQSLNKLGITATEQYIKKPVLIISD